MNRWQTIAVATGVVTLLSAGTALAVGVGQDSSPNAADARDGSAAAGAASVVQVDDRKTSSPRPTTSRTPMAKAKVSAEAAQKIALAKVGGGYVDEVERELEHGRWEWKIEVIKSGTEYDVRVDAQTGAITRFRADDRDDRDDRGDDRRSDDDSDDRSRNRSDDSGDDRGDDHGRDRDDRDDDDNSGRGGHDDDDHADDHGGDRDDDNSGHGSDDD